MYRKAPATIKGRVWPSLASLFEASLRSTFALNSPKTPPVIVQIVLLSEP